MEPTLIERRLENVQARIRSACERVGRNPDEVTLVAVTKTFPEDTILAAHRAGLRHFGENKAQEFDQKFEALNPKIGDEVTWHFIGHLQRNKVKLVAGRAHLIHGVDSPRLARALQRYAENEDLQLQCFIQLNVSGEESKFGIEPEALPEMLQEVRSLDRITFKGLMTLASPTSDEGRLRSEFKRMRAALDESRNSLESMTYLSMGMTGDFEIAVEEGATHVRIGSAIFGPRG
jgi:pyridoxal phosphate enzyme (YggS family)